MPTVQYLRSLDTIDAAFEPVWQPASLERIHRVHGATYINDIKQFARQRRGYIESDTVVSERSFDVALMAAGAVCDAVERIDRAEDRTAFCLVRPPGHHAMPNQAMGFCLFNNVAVASRVATMEKGYDRVLVIDWDVHHGNGTQAIFWEDPQVAYFSIHRHPFYPGTGFEHETGAGAGDGTTRNLPIRFGTPPNQQIEWFQRELEAFANQFQPQLVIVSAGFDAHRDDPIGSLGLASHDFATLTAIVKDVASSHASGKIISVLEGGYNPQALAECVESHLSELIR